MSDNLWIFLGLAVLVVVGYFVTMRVFFKDSKELDKKIDMSKMRAWKDEEPDTCVSSASTMKKMPPPA